MLLKNNTFFVFLSFYNLKLLKVEPHNLVLTPLKIKTIGSSVEDTMSSNYMSRYESGVFLRKLTGSN